MRKLMKLIVFATVFVITALPAMSDTLVLKSGERVNGFFEGGSARVVKFRTVDGTLKDYDILTVQSIHFDDDKGAANTAMSNGNVRATSPSTAPRLAPASERPPAHPTSSNAASTGWTVPTGSKVQIRLIDSINSEQNKVGETFLATLDEPIVVDGIEVVPRNADVRGRIAKLEGAGRIAGSAELGLELTEIIVNGIPYSVTTSEYQEVGEGRGSQTAKRAAVGAGIGAVIGAIAGGGKGAAIGAGVGGGGATAVQVMTKGQKLNIPSETKLEFTLRAPFVIAAK